MLRPIGARFVTASVTSPRDAQDRLWAGVRAGREVWIRHAQTLGIPVGEWVYRAPYDSSSKPRSQTQPRSRDARSAGFRSSERASGAVGNSDRTRPDGASTARRHVALAPGETRLARPRLSDPKVRLDAPRAAREARTDKHVGLRTHCRAPALRALHADLRVADASSLSESKQSLPILDVA